jgi:LEA14-like dessication related protein
MKRYLLYLCISAFLFTGCRMQEVQCTGVKGFKVNSISAAGIDGDIMLGIKNPNNFGFSIYKSDFNVTYSGVFLGKARLSKRVHIGANAEVTNVLNLKNDFKNVNLMDVMKLLGGAARKGQLEIQGDLNVGKFYFRKKLPVNVQERIGWE